MKPVHIPLPELWEQYLAYAKAHKRSWERDVQVYRHLQNFLGTATLTSITPLRVEVYQLEVPLNETALAILGGQARGEARPICFL